MEYVSQFRVIDDEYKKMYIAKISRGIVKYVYKIILFRFVEVRYKIPLITK